MEKTIQVAVAEKISTCGETVKNTVVDKLADIEIQKRIDTITKAIQKQEQMEKELKKISKNDIVNYNGTEAIELMSKARYEEIKKGKERITKLIAATELALENNTIEAYTKLTETLNKLNNVGGDKKESSGETEE